MEKIKVYNLLLKNYSANIDFLFSTEATCLDEAWDLGRIAITNKKGNPLQFALVTYTIVKGLMREKENADTKTIDVKTNKISLENEKVILEKKKKLGKQDFINNIELIKDKFATSTDKIILDKMIKRIKNEKGVKN